MKHAGRGAVGEVSPVNSPADALRLESRPSTPVRVCDDKYFLARKASSGNLQTTAKGAADGCVTSAILPADYYCSFSRTSQSVPSKEVVVVSITKVLHDTTQCSSEAHALFGDAAEGVFLASPAKSTMEELLSFCDDAVAASPPFPPAGLFLGSENENPRVCTVESLPTPRAPMKPTRVRSINTLLPGKTRRKLDFNHL